MKKQVSSFNSQKQNKLEKRMSPRLPISFLLVLRSASTDSNALDETGAQAKHWKVKAR